MRRRKQETPGRDWLEELNASRALKLMAVGAGTPEDERRWARAAGFSVAELRRRVSFVYADDAAVSNIA